jgi:hypothetical protein
MWSAAACRRFRRRQLFGNKTIKARLASPVAIASSSSFLALEVVVEFVAAGSVLSNRADFDSVCVAAAWSLGGSF